MKRRDNDVYVLQWCMDGCSGCVEAVVKPFFVFLAESKSSIQASYRCDTCVREWRTSWDYDFAIEHALDHLREAGISIKS